MGEKKTPLEKFLCPTMIVVVTFVLIFSLFLPVLSSASDIDSTPTRKIGEGDEEKNSETTRLSDEDADLQGRVEAVKEVQTSDIWHSEVEDPSAAPFDTNKTTVYLNMTGHGNLSEVIHPFDWISSIDSSGSMDLNDPDDNRISGAQHFVDLVAQNATSSRGASIDYDDTATLINNHSLSDDYSTIKQDLETIGAEGGTDFSPPLQLALDEFQDHGYTSRSWFHLFLTDGQGLIDWSLVDQHANMGIPIYTIGFGDADDQILQDMADDTGGEYHPCQASELNQTFETIFESIYENATGQNKTAVVSPPGEPMVREVLPPSVEYIEGSAEPQENFTVSKDGGNTVLEWDRIGLDIDETWEIKYDVRANNHSHSLPITAYNATGDPLSRIKYENVSSEDIEVIPTPGPELGVHGLPDPVIGASRWHGVEAGENITFKNMTWDGDQKSSWPGDCEIVNYNWDFGDGIGGEGEMINHSYDTPGTYNVSLTATTVDGVNATVTENITVESTPPPYFNVTIDSPAEGAEYLEGKNVTVDYTVENTGNETDTQDIEFYVDDALIDTEEGVDLSPDETFHGTFNWTAAEPYGQRDLSVESQNESDTVSIQVLEGVTYYTLNVNVDGQGSVEKEPDRPEYEESTEVNLTATPDQGWKFVNWTGDYTGTERNITVTMDGDKSVTAHFQEKGAVIYNLTVDEEGQGSVEKDPDQPEYEEGTEVNLTATPDQGWKFVNWTGDYTGTERNITVTMDGDKSVTAHFQEEQDSGYTLTIEVVGEGEVQKDPDRANYDEGTEVELEAVPDSGWDFSHWIGDYPAGEQETKTITITMDEDKSLTAYFEDVNQEIEYQLEINIDGQGSTDPSGGTHTYYAGEMVLVSATPDQGWKFVKWTGDVPAGEESNEEITTINMDGNKSITAHFAEKSNFEVEITSPEDGASFEEGQEITIGYSVEITGTEGTQDIVLSIEDEDGSEVHSSEEQITLEADETKDGEFTWEIGGTGDYTLEVTSDDASDSVTITATEGSTDGDNGTSSPGYNLISDYWWILLLLGLVILIAIVLAVRGGKEDEEERYSASPPPPAEGRVEGGPEEGFESDTSFKEGEEIEQRPLGEEAVEEEPTIEEDMGWDEGEEEIEPEEYLDSTEEETE
ncbi:MAG: InlB B-repeat-containing protein [Candidatus Aenigmatarchaeota archaeon]